MCGKIVKKLTTMKAFENYSNFKNAYYAELYKTLRLIALRYKITSNF